MFTRVGAFLEAIDKKTESLANAADEQDIARAANEHARRSFDTVISSSTSLKSTPRTVLHPDKSNGRSDAAGDGSTPFSTTELPHSIMTPSSHIASDERHTAHLIPLSLPTKLPSFRSPSQDADTVDSRKSADTGRKRPLTLYQKTDSPARNVLDASQGIITTASVEAAGRSHLVTSSTTAAAVERLEARCKVLEAERLRWQQEAATGRAQCSAVRDALWKAEQDARSSRAAQRAAEEALMVHKETSQRLLTEAQLEVKRARDAAAELPSGPGQMPQTDASQEALQLRQQLELLQANHAFLDVEVKRHRQEAANLTTQLQRAQDKNREMQARIDTLELELGSARESLEGEVAAHAETRSDVRRLQAQTSTSVRGGEGHRSASSTATRSAGDVHAAVDLTQLQTELSELKQRNQLLSLQASNRQAALDSATREAAEMKARYNELAKQMQDAEVEMAAGFRAPPLAASSLCSHRVYGSGGNETDGRSADTGAYWAHDARAVSGSTDYSALARRRNAVMARLARQYGIAGRATASVLCNIDNVALQIGRVLTQASWVWRVVLMSYVGILQVWVVVMIIGTLALEDKVYVLKTKTIPEPV